MNRVTEQRGMLTLEIAGLAELSDFIAPTVSAKAYADEIWSYHS